MITVIVVDDHPLVREGIVAILSRDPELQVVGEAASGPEAVVSVGALQPDVVLLDLRMPGGDGVDAIRELRARSADKSRILVLTTYDTDHDVRAALEAGADGFLLKDTPRAELIRAVHELAAGRPALAPAALRAMRGRDAQVHLTPREAEVLESVALGGTNRIAAARLHMSETTLKTHLARVYDKLGVSDRAAAVRVAYERGLL